MLSDQQTNMRFDLPQEPAAVANVLIEHNVGPLMLDLRRENFVQPFGITPLTDPRDETPATLELPRPLLRPAHAVLPRPGLLHDFVVGVNLSSFVAELAQIAGIEVGDAKQAFHPHLHLFFIGLIFQAYILAVKPVEKLGVVDVENEEFHLRN